LVFKNSWKITSFLFFYSYFFHEKFYTTVMMYHQSHIISESVSNNRLDFEKRSHPEIVVPRLIEWALDDVKISNNIAIECELDGKIQSGYGLEHFIFLQNSRVPTWIMDNHNHAFAFWHEALFRWYIQPWSLLVHIDQHNDLGTPAEMPMKNEEWIMNNGGNCLSSSDERNHCFAGLIEDPVIQANKLHEESVQSIRKYSDLDSGSRLSLFTQRKDFPGMTDHRFDTLQEIENYTNSVLTIADFIVPALADGLISEAVMITGEDIEGAGLFIWKNEWLVKLSKEFSTINNRSWRPKNLIVDLDLDYFAQWFDELKTMENVRFWLEKADIITIATSPLFIDQEKAINILKNLQKSLITI